MIKSFDYSNPQQTSTPVSGNIKPFEYQPVSQQSTPVTTTSFPNGIIGGVKTLGSDIYGALTKESTPPTEGYFSEKNPTVAGSIVLPVLNTMASAYKDVTDKFSHLPAVLSGHSSALDKGVATGEAGMSALNAFFAPLAAAGSGAENIPVIGGLAKGINNIFGTIGTVGSDVLEGSVQSLPFLSQETKDKITPLFKEIGALAAQVVVGVKGEKIFNSLAEKTKQAVDVINSDIHGTKLAIEAGVISPDKLIEPVTTVKPFDYSKVEPTTAKEFIASQNKATSEKISEETRQKALSGQSEDVRLTDQTPVTIYRSGTGEIKPGDFVTTSKDVAAAYKEQRPGTDIVTSNITNNDLIKSGKQDEYVYAPKGLKVDATPSGVAQDIQARAIEQNLTTGYKDIAGYDASTFKAEAIKTSDLINSGIDNFRSVIRGEKPTDIKAGSLIAGAQEYAKTHPEVAADIYQELANSHLASTISTGASETSFARMIKKDSAASKLDEVRKAREVKTTPEKKTTTKKQVEQSIKKTNLSEAEMGKLEKFINDNIC